MSGSGGAWKVAYADFVTAMMALFMVLWILGSEDEILEHLQEYFRNPPSPFNQESGKYITKTGDFSGYSEADAKGAYFDQLDPAVLKGIINEFYRVLDMEQNSDRVPAVDITVTSDGLRVALYDRQDTPLFQSNHAQLTSWADFVAQNLAWLIARYPFEVMLESYTSELPTIGDGQWKSGDTEWELSTRRGNIFRRRLQFYANDQLDFRSVVGYGSNYSFSPEEIAQGKTSQRIALSLSLANRQQLPDFSMIGEDLLIPKQIEKPTPTEESEL